jgi:tetratricopeptide (TPR) repeat protein
MLPSNSEVPLAIGRVAVREGHRDQSITYFERGLTLDPRNMELLMTAAWNYSTLRQFPAALKLYDRALDIMANNPDVIKEKASIYQAQGNLEEAARLLAGVHEQTDIIYGAKIIQLRLERNYGEAIRLLQARLAQFHFTSETRKASDQLDLAFMQLLAGDTTGAKLTAEQARTTYEQQHRDQPERSLWAAYLSQAYAAMGEKDSALKLAERAIVLQPSAKDHMAGNGPSLEENLALIQTIFGENSRAIATLTQLLQLPYAGFFLRTPITPALLRLDPFWDPLRADPAFQKLCEEKQP